MKGIPSSHDFELQELFDTAEISPDLWESIKQSCFADAEPTSVLEATGSPSSPASHSTSISGDVAGASTGMTPAAPAKRPQDTSSGSTLVVESSIDTFIQPTAGGICVGGGGDDGEKCWPGMAMEGWGSVSPTQDPSVIPWVVTRDLEVDSAVPASAGDNRNPFPCFTDGGSFSFPLPPDFSLVGNLKIPSCPQNPMFSPWLCNVLPQQTVDSVDEKSQIFNPHLLANHQLIDNPPNPPYLLPLPSPKRHNPSGQNEPRNSVITRLKPVLDLDQASPELRPPLDQQFRGFPDQSLPQHLRPSVIDRLLTSAEMLEKGNLVLAQGILARLNQLLSSAGNPFERAAFCLKEALQLLLCMSISNFSSHPSQFSLVHKIRAYKLFSEISPIPQFSNFTCIQAIIEAVEGLDRIHIVDFDIGYGGQWASLMQELGLRKCEPFCLKITAFVSPIIHDELELSLTRQNLNHFASEINMVFEFEFITLDSLSSASSPLPLSENEAIAVNLPVGSSSNCSFPLLLALRFAKQLSPKIIVSMDRGYHGSDLSFPHYIRRVFQSYWTLLESLDAVNLNMDDLRKIEKFLLVPNIEKIVLGHHIWFHEKEHSWRAIFMSAGLSPLMFSNFNESQAECVVKRYPVRGFHVEKRHSSLVLCWQQKELISVSTWRF